MPASKEQLKKLREMRARLRMAEKLAGIGKANLSAQQNAYHQAKSADLRDIAAKFSWQPKDSERRAACKEDPERWLRTYLPYKFCCPFSPTHRLLIRDTADVLAGGGQKAKAMSRGFGKTSIFSGLALWATLNGLRRFVPVIGATDHLAESTMEAHIKRELTENPLLIADFPEICNPFVALENNGRKCKGQLFDGQRTLIEWSAERLVVADIPPTIAAGTAGSVFLTRSITGAMRGITHKLRDGTIIRPDALLLDDIQTRESAGSPAASKKRIQIVQGDALGLAGHDRRIAAMMAVTPIYDGDAACYFLDRAKAPEWRGDTTPMVLAFPERDDLWDQYRTILHEALRTDGDPQAATRFYLENREEMDRGAVVAWPERIPEGYVAALQYAMDLKFRDPEAFAAEYQCRPLTTEVAAGLMLPRDEVAAKVNGLKRGAVPPETHALTCFVDVGDSYLFYAVCAFAKTFQGACLEYAAFPPQNKRYFTKSEASPTLAGYLAARDKSLAGSPMKTVLAAGLDLCLADLLARTWQDAEGQVYTLNQILVDAGYEGDVVRGAIARLKLPPERLPRVMPSHGVGYGAKQKPMASLAKKPGDVVGCHWRAAQPDAGRPRTVTIDVNYWKTALHQQLAAPLGQNGCFSLYGDKRTDHNLLADHLTAENPNRVTAEGKGQQQTVIEWLLKPARENEALDCLVGCFAAASMRDCQLSGAAGLSQRSNKRKADWSQYAKL